MYNKHFATNLFLGKYFMTFTGSYKWNSTINTVSPQTDRQTDRKMDRKTERQTHTGTMTLSTSGFFANSSACFWFTSPISSTDCGLILSDSLALVRKFEMLLKSAWMECLRALSSASWSRCRWSSIEDFTGSVDTVIQSTLMVLCTRRDHY